MIFFDDIAYTNIKMNDAIHFHTFFGSNAPLVYPGIKRTKTIKTVCIKSLKNEENILAGNISSKISGKSLRNWVQKVWDRMSLNFENLWKRKKWIKCCIAICYVTEWFHWKPRCLHGMAIHWCHCQLKHCCIHQQDWGLEYTFFILMRTL